MYTASFPFHYLYVVIEHRYIHPTILEVQFRMHTDKSFSESCWIQPHLVVIFTFPWFIWHRTEFYLGLNKSEMCNYILDLVDFNEIQKLYLCVWLIFHLHRIFEYKSATGANKPRLHYLICIFGQNYRFSTSKGTLY